MNQRPDPRRAGIAVGDVLIVLSLVCFVFAVLYPRLRRAAYEDRIDAAASAVEAVRASAQSHLESEGTWPAESPVGTIPAELVGRLPQDFSPVSDTYTMDWNLWQTVRPPPPAEADQTDYDPDMGAAAPVARVEVRPEDAVSQLSPLAGITVYSDEEGILAALLERYGQTRSFIRDGSWTLILEGAG